MRKPTKYEVLRSIYSMLATERSQTFYTIITYLTKPQHFCHSLFEFCHQDGDHNSQIIMNQNIICNSKLIFK